MFTKSAECTDSHLLAPASSRIVLLQWVLGWSSASSSHQPNPPGWCLGCIFCRCWLTPRRELLLERLEHEWKDSMASAGEAFREHAQYIVPKGKAWLLKKADPQSSPRAPTSRAEGALSSLFIGLICEHRPLFWSVWRYWWNGCLLGMLPNSVLTGLGDSVAVRVKQKQKCLPSSYMCRWFNIHRIKPLMKEDIDFPGIFHSIYGLQRAEEHGHAGIS